MPNTEVAIVTGLGEAAIDRSSLKVNDVVFDGS
jgi:hypothetical protein